MKNILISLVFVSILAGSSFASEEVEQVLNNPAIKALYSLPTKIWFESLYKIGRPSASAYAYVTFESLNLANSNIGLKVGRDVMVEIAKRYTDNPESVCIDIANSMMAVGIDSYRINYERYRVWKKTEGIMSDYDKFLEDNKTVNYLWMGKALFADVQAYKYKQGKYEWSANLGSLGEKSGFLTDKLGAISTGISETASFISQLNEFMKVAKGNLAQYPPYSDHLARVAELEKKSGREFPIAKVQTSEENKELTIEKQEDMKFEKNPPSPNMKLQDAIELGNAKEVWANIYHKTFNIKESNTSWIIYTLVTDFERRMRKLNELVQKDKELADLYNTNLSSFLDKSYNLTKSKEFTRIIALLIGNGADINQEISNGVTPLSAAVFQYNMDAIHLLVSAGAEVNAKVIDEALNKKNPNLITYLIKNAKSIDRDVLLFKMVREGYYEPTQLLVAYGAKINSLDESGCSPLYYAVEKENIPLVMFLLKNGADVERGLKSPIGVAVNKGNQTLAGLLKSYADGSKERVKVLKNNPGKSSAGISDINEFANEALEAVKSGDSQFFIDNSAVKEDCPLIFQDPLIEDAIGDKGRFKEKFEDYISKLNDGKVLALVQKNLEGYEAFANNNKTFRIKFVRCEYSLKDLVLAVFASVENQDSKIIRLEFYSLKIDGRWKFMGGLQGFGIDEDAQKPSEVKDTKENLRMLSEAVRQFKLDCGRYPTEAEGLGVLVKAPQGVKRWNGYWDSDNLPTDEWGNDFFYLPYPENGKPYVVISAGPDGKMWTRDDMYSSN